VTIDFHEHLTESISSIPQPEMPNRFSFSGDASEEVFDCESQTQLLVSLEFTDIDHCIGLHDLTINLKFQLDLACCFYGDRASKFDDGDSEFRRDAEDSTGLCCPLGGAESWRVTNSENCPDIEETSAESAHHLWVWRNRGLGWRCPEKVRLDEDPVT